ncbi:hypothetical protein Sango_2779200 [Sesamum angolense]|uniref:Myb/SANT-like domain-containing protein n=1 Tax=Sesamum angolense TaxID=2727404 RepID=A0AAE1W0R9_9LAMI|nr:hypothetical protein Sango_2779200 [Sesamum angolense]
MNGLKYLITGGSDNGFRNSYLPQLEAHMNRVFPQCNIKAEPHITSKLHVWKKQYSTLVTMMTKSGLGWDESRHMVTVEDDKAWEEFVKDRATREQSIDPKKVAADKVLPEAYDAHDCYVLTSEWNLETGFHELDEEQPQSYNMNCDHTLNSSSATKRTTSSRKRKVSDDCPKIPQLVNTISNFCETANNRIGSLSRVLESEFGDPDKRDVVMQQVREISGHDENDFLIVTRKLVHERKDKDMFFSLSKESKEKMVRLILAGRI